MYATKHHGEVPDDLKDLTKYVPNGEVPGHAWGRPFRYLHGRGSPDYFIVSLGADGRVGGEDDDTDMRSDREWPG